MAINNTSPLSAQEIQDLKQLMLDLRNIKIPDIDKFVKALGGVGNARRELEILRKQFANINSDVNSIFEQLKNITNEVKKGNEGYKLTVTAFTRLSSIATKLKADQDGIQDLNKKDLKNIMSKLGIERNNLELSLKLNEARVIDLKNIISDYNYSKQKRDLAKEELSKTLEASSITKRYLADQEEGYEHLVALTGQRIKFEDDINKTLGVTGNLILGLEKTLGKLGLGGLIDLDEINNKIRLTAENTVKVAEANGRNVSLLDKTKVLGSALKSSFGDLATALDDPALVLAGIVAASIEADKQTTDIAKSMMIWKSNAVQVRQEFVEMSQNISDTYITTDKLIAANQELTKQLGFNKIFTQDIDKTFIDLTQKIGITVDAAGNLTKISIATGKTLKGTEQTILGITSKISAQNGIQLDGKDILEETGRISGQLLAIYKANPAAIAEAVAQAKILGTTLETTKKQSEFLLDFESSITAELKAELLTGQTINLEKARSAALSGDMVGVMKELNNQNVDFSKYSQMNVIQQKAFAESLGLSSDELSNQLLKQQYLNKSRSEILAIGGEEAANRMEQLTAQDKFNAAVDKLKDILGNLIAGPFGELLSVLGDMLNIVSVIAKPFELIGGWIDKATTAGSGLATVLKEIAAVAAVISAFIWPWQTLASLAIAGIAIAGVEALTSKKGNDIISPGTNSAGYGSRTLFGPEGAIQLNNKDTIVAGTDLNKNTSNSSSSQISNATIDITPMITAINEVRIAVEKLYSKNNGIYMDGKKVGTTLVQGSYKVA